MLEESSTVNRTPVQGFPLRAKSEFYRQTLYRILTKSQGQSDGFGQVCLLVDKMAEAQCQALGRAMTSEESHVLKLRTLRDARTTLIALSMAMGAAKDYSETQVRRTRNLPYLQWRIEKEILALHWQVELNELDDRQVRSGMRMPRFLADAIEAEGLN